MIYHFIRNPVSLWFYYLITSIYYELKYHKGKLKIGNMTYVKKCEFGSFNRLYDNVKLKNVQLGDFTYVAANTQIKNTNVGKFCSIATDCRIGLGRHPTRDFVSTHPVFFSVQEQVPITFVNKNYFKEEESIKIGNDVWIGTGVIIVDGVIISDGAIIAAGSVVTKNIPPYAIVGGIPATIIRYRFEKNIIDKLLDIKWWDMNTEDLKKNFKIFHNTQSFFDEY